jgi:glycosyltransferase involved in cell wall biosynthesis
MRVLAVNVYHGGSHRAFLEGWQSHSRHEFTTLTLPPRHWRWRMRHGAVTLAEAASERWQSGTRWDALWCTDMLNLAEWRGLVTPEIASLPRVVYFHENQLTYPRSGENDARRDAHLEMTNLTTALAADRVWFNSAYHRDDFLQAAQRLLAGMPDYRMPRFAEAVRSKSSVYYPGVHAFPEREQRDAGPLRIVWAARWEADKNPQEFFEALDILEQQRVEFRISVVGPSAGTRLPCFDAARERFCERLDHWGYVEDRDAYRGILAAADVAVSTARHEFFGIATVEAAAAGAMPLVPRRLSYPEVFQREGQFFYDGTPADLARRLAEAGRRLGETASVWQGDPRRGRNVVERFRWPDAARALDGALESIV